MFHQPTDIAKQLNVSAFTIRRWCDLHSMHLSAGANPKAGRTRRLDDRDLEVLRTIAQFRSEGYTTEEINERLANIAFAVPVPQDAPTIVQDSITGGLAPTVGIDASTALTAPISSIETRLAVIETRLDAKHFDVASFAYGFLACGVLFALLLLLALLFRG